MGLESRPIVFVGSSVKYLPIAYAIQENWEHAADVRVWNQGWFAPSSMPLDSLTDALDVADFGVFVFGPEDIVMMSSAEHRVTRDNVIFELGLFIGRLGKARSFIVMPRGVTDFKLPTDLVGLTTAQYNAGDSDKNPVSALGAASHKMLRVVEAQGTIKKASSEIISIPLEDEPEPLDTNDCLAILHSWMSALPGEEKYKVMRYQM